MNGGEPRKVVCCTNIAETSLTIERVRFVIDSGKARKLSYDHQLWLTTLKVEDVGRASVRQRRGRARRTASGFFYPLYSQAYHEQRMPLYEEPAIKQMPAEELVLRVLSAGGASVADLGLLDPPDRAAIESAQNRLLNLGFVELAPGPGGETRSGLSEERLRLTEDGKFALSLGGCVDLEAARMLLAAEALGCMHDALKLAALLAERYGGMFAQVAAGSAAGTPSRGQEEQRLNCVHEFGDHFTALES